MKRVAAEIAENQRNHLPLVLDLKDVEPTAQASELAEAGTSVTPKSSRCQSHFVAWQSFSNSGHGR